jgi:hypothetical protein
MKLNRTRKEWDHVRLNCRLLGYERFALEDLATLHAEVERLRGALKQIGRMHLMPDDKVNRTTLMMAREVAHQALGDHP